MRVSHRVKRAIAVGATGALALSLLPGVAAADTKDFSQVCAGAPSDSFEDAGTTHADAIDCMNAYTGPDGEPLFRGFADGTAGPFEDLTRGQFASLMYRFALTAQESFEFDDDHDAQFDDVAEDGEHTEAIEALAGAGIVQGYADSDDFGVFDPLQRGQAASIAAGVLTELGATLPDPSDRDTTFEDVDEDGEHTDAIYALEAADIVEGTSEAEFSPWDTFLRGQGASILARSAQVLLEQDLFDAYPLRQPVESRYEGPELTDAQLAVTGSGEFSVDYTFDEEITSGDLDADGFHLFSFLPQGELGDSVAEADDAHALQPEGVIKQDDHTARAVYTVDPAVLDLLTTASVSHGAAADADGLATPEGSVAFGDGVSFDEGRTAAPDITDVGVSTTDDDQVEVEYVFDANIDGEVEATDFHVVTDDGAEFTATEADADDNAVTATGFAVGEDLIEDALGSETDEIVRAYADAGAVADVLGFANPLHAHGIGDGDTEDAPNLVDVEVDASNDEATYTFDRSVNLALGSGGEGFALSYVDGTEATPATGAPEREDDQSFTVSFEAGAVDELITGASVAFNTVEASTVTELSNATDSVGVAGVSYDAGATAASALDAVEIVENTTTDTTTGEETVESFEVTFGYDAAVTTAEADQHWFYHDGERTSLGADGITVTHDAGDSEVVATVADEDDAAELFEALVDGDATLITVEYAGATSTTTHLELNATPAAVPLP